MLKGIKNRWKILFASTLLVTGACKQTSTVDEFVNIPNQSWPYSFEPEVSVYVEDKNQPYQIYLNLKHSGNYPYSNLYILLHGPIKKDSMQGNATPERIELLLAEPDGKWTGKGSAGLYTHQKLIKENYKFTDTGMMTFRIEQNMRDNPLTGIVASGLRIAPIE